MAFDLQKYAKVQNIIDRPVWHKPFDPKTGSEAREAIPLPPEGIAIVSRAEHQVSFKKRHFVEIRPDVE